MDVQVRNIRRFQAIELQDFWLLITSYYSIASKFAQVLGRLKG